MAALTTLDGYDERMKTKGGRREDGIVHALSLCLKNKVFSAEINLYHYNLALGNVKQNLTFNTIT